MIRVGLYSRYSDADDQRESSIVQQERLLRQRAALESWEVAATFADCGITGAIRSRPGLQALLTGARNRDFDIVLSESVDRLSRDQEDIAWLFKRCRWHNVDIVTLLEGEVTRWSLR